MLRLRIHEVALLGHVVSNRLDAELDELFEIADLLEAQLVVDLTLVDVTQNRRLGQRSALITILIFFSMRRRLRSLCV